MNSDDLQIEKKRTTLGGVAVVAAVEVMAVAVVVVAAVAVVAVMAVAAVVVVAVEEEGQEIVLVVTIPPRRWSACGHQLEQKSERGYFQDSLETWGFSRD